MPRFSNVGGVRGFGPIDTSDSHKPFEWVWEARVWAMSMLMTGKGHAPIDAKRDVGEQLGAQEYLRTSYYEQRLAVLEALLEDAGLIDRGALDRLVEAAARDQEGHGHWHGQPSSGSRWETSYE